LIEWNLPVTGISLDIIERVVVNALDDDQPVDLDSIPSKSQKLPNTQ